MYFKKMMYIFFIFIMCSGCSTLLHNNELQYLHQKVERKDFLKTPKGMYNPKLHPKYRISSSFPHVYNIDYNDKKYLLIPPKN